MVELRFGEFTNLELTFKIAETVVLQNKGSRMRQRELVTSNERHFTLDLLGLRR